jgi:hypothetical protein
MVSFKHPERDCVFAEAAVLSGMKWDDQETISQQMRKYRDWGHSEHALAMTNYDWLACATSLAVGYVLEVMLRFLIGDWWLWAGMASQASSGVMCRSAHSKT